MSLDTKSEVEAVNVEERELVQFDQIDEFCRILHSDDFFPGGLQEGRQVQLPLNADKDGARARDAKGEESLRRLTSIVSPLGLLLT
jgi:hypothetical protein